jgi:hypothetical protein
MITVVDFPSWAFWYGSLERRRRFFYGKIIEEHHRFGDD